MSGTTLILIVLAAGFAWFIWRQMQQAQLQQAALIAQMNRGAKEKEGIFERLGGVGDDAIGVFKDLF